MSKHIARLIVTVIILGILGYVGYTYFFNPDVNLHVYDKTLSLTSDYMSDNSIYENFKKLKEKNYYGADTENVITNSPIESVAFNARKMLFNFENVDKDFSNKTLVGDLSGETGLVTLVNELNSATMFYLTHAQFAKSVNRSDISAFNSAIKRLTKSTDEINNDIVTLLARQNKNETNTALFNQINTSYSNLVSKVVNHSKLQAELLKELKDFVVAKSYNGNFIYETSAIFYNSLIYTTLNLNAEMNSADINKVIYETMLIVSSNTNYKNDLQNSQSEADNNLIRFYNDIVNERPQLLFGNSENSIFAYSYEDKLKLAQNGGFENKVAIKYQDNVEHILKALGY